jgi:hypothetical protein
LDAATFWAHKDFILADGKETSPEAVEMRVQMLLQQKQFQTPQITNREEKNNLITQTNNTNNNNNIDSDNNNDNIENIENCKNDVNNFLNLKWIGQTGIALGDSTTTKIIGETKKIEEKIWKIFGAVVDCSETPNAFFLASSSQRPEETQSRYLHLPIPTTKRGKHGLGALLGTGMKFVYGHLCQKKQPVLIYASGKMDVALYLCLAILLQHFNDSYSELREQPERRVDKPKIQKTLLYIVAHCPQATTPPRAMMKELNILFMS